MKALEKKIIRSISQSACNQIPFSVFMNMCLYDHEEGFYTGGHEVIGKQGSFVTAPELGEELAEIIGNYFLHLLAELKDPIIVEVGAGKGTLSYNLISFLKSNAKHSFDYEIIEISASMIAKQKKLLEPFKGLVTWNSPSDAFEDRDCIVIANEFLDAIPFDRFVKLNNDIYPLMVTYDNKLSWKQHELPLSTDALKQFGVNKEIFKSLPEGYQSELHAYAELIQIIQKLQCAKSVCALFIDYGYGERDYYAAHRTNGTLSCFMQHQISDNPFLMLGEQDITSWVNYTRVKNVLESNGFLVSGYTTQAEFLLSGGIDKYLNRAFENSDFQRVQNIKTLMLPGEMGEYIKVLLATKNLNQKISLTGRSFLSRI